MKPTKFKQVQNLEGGIMQSHIMSGLTERGADYGYAIYYEKRDEHDQNTTFSAKVKFQEGDPREELNGIRDEDLLAILLHRAECFLKNYPSDSNRRKAEHLKAAIDCCNERAKKRIEAGVQGDVTAKEVVNSFIKCSNKVQVEKYRKKPAVTIHGDVEVHGTVDLEGMDREDISEQKTSEAKDG